MMAARELPPHRLRNESLAHTLEQILCHPTAAAMYFLEMTISKSTTIATATAARTIRTTEELH